MRKKGDVWVSAVLYIALGMIVITLILSAGLPLIEKMRDKNTIVQTKKLLSNLNANIEVVANEGLGSKRYFSPFEISAGVLNVDYVKDLLIWKMTTKNVMMKPTELKDIKDCPAINSESCKPLEVFKEGALNMWMLETSIEGEYEIYVELKYGYIDIDYNPDMPTSLVGRYSLSIEQKGFTVDKPVVFLGVT